LGVRLTSHRKIKLFRNPEEGQGSQRVVVPVMMMVVMMMMMMLMKKNHN
jgi:hypothetical protein